MKNTTYLILITIIFAAFACKKSEEPYAFYRPSNPQNFINIRGGELYAYTANDSVIVRADYYLRVMGQIKTYGNQILQYGHVWHKTNAFPTIGIDTLMTKSTEPFTGDSISYTSSVTKLKAKTKYYLRSYIITGDGNGNVKDTGYNPVVTIVETKDAIDEWFAQNGDQRPGGGRFDAVAFNLGDTIFFGSGNQGNKFLVNDISMYDPLANVWTDNFATMVSIQFPPKPPDVNVRYLSRMTNGVAFAIAYKPVDASATAPYTKSIFIGLGDYWGDDLYIDKSKTLLEYDLGTRVWRETYVYSGGPKSGSVAFVLDGKAYIGTGNNNPGYAGATSDWYSFDPALNKDNKNPWKSVPAPPGNLKRIGAIAFSLNGRGYFGLGRDDAGNFHNDFWEFRPVGSGSWVKKANFPGTPRANAAAFALGDQGYVGTGDNINGDMEVVYTGQTFSDFYRYDPFDDKWFKQADYTTDKTNNLVGKKVTRGVGFALQKKNIGFIGFGILPEVTENRAQSDLWHYQPFASGAK